MIDYQAAAIHLWCQERYGQFLDASELEQGFYLDRATSIVDAALGDTVLVSPDDLCELKDWAEVCDHIDHHGYCQTHGLGDTDGNGLCGIGRLVVLAPSVYPEVEK